MFKFITKKNFDKLIKKIDLLQAEKENLRLVIQTYKEKENSFFIDRRKKIYEIKEQSVNKNFKDRRTDTKLSHDTLKSQIELLSNNKRIEAYENYINKMDFSIKDSQIEKFINNIKEGKNYISMYFLRNYEEENLINNKTLISNILNIQHIKDEEIKNNIISYENINLGIFIKLFFHNNFNSINVKNLEDFDNQLLELVNNINYIDNKKNFASISFLNYKIKQCKHKIKIKNIYKIKIIFALINKIKSLIEIKEHLKMLIDIKERKSSYNSFVNEFKTYPISEEVKTSILLKNQDNEYYFDQYLTNFLAYKGYKFEVKVFNMLNTYDNEFQSNIYKEKFINCFDIYNKSIEVNIEVKNININDYMGKDYMNKNYMNKSNNSQIIEEEVEKNNKFNSSKYDFKNIVIFFNTPNITYPDLSLVNQGNNMLFDNS